MSPELIPVLISILGSAAVGGVVWGMWREKVRNLETRIEMESNERKRDQEKYVQTDHFREMARRDAKSIEEMQSDIKETRKDVSKILLVLLKKEGKKASGHPDEDEF